jgi:hypothetical protein
MVPHSGIRQSHLLALPLTLLFLLLLSTPVLYMGLADTDTFSASVTVSNLAPSVYVDVGQSVGGIQGTSSTVYIYFNASDPNGAGDLNTTSAVVTINKTGNTDRTSSGCTVDSDIDVNTRRYNCSVTIYFYDEAGPWTINATILDNTSNTASNTSATISLNVIDSLDVVQNSISFSGTPGTNDIAASPQQQLNNTGNQDYTTVSITGYDFDNAGNTIGVDNVTTNITDSSGLGQTLTSGAPVTVTGSTLPRGDNSLEDIYFWLDVPSGVPSGSYSATSNWVFEAT